MSTVLSVRMSDEENALLRSAAADDHATISEYVRRAALIAAENALMDRRVVEIPAEHWEEFEAMLNAPPRDLPGLRKLAERTPAWAK